MLSNDSNMDFRSFDNGFKQLCVTNSMQEFIFKYGQLTDKSLLDRMPPILNNNLQMENGKNVILL